MTRSLRCFQRIITRTLYDSAILRSPADDATTQTFHNSNGRLKIDITRKQLVGTHQSRGERPYQEDTFVIKAIHVEQDEIQRGLKGVRDESHPSAGSLGNQAKNTAKQPEDANASTSEEGTLSTSEQVLLAAVFDGHNGASVSKFLRDELHSRILSCSVEAVPDIVERYRKLGGYMRRYRGGILRDLLETGKTAEEKKKQWTVQQRLHAAFLNADLEIIETEQDAGAVATLALLHSLDEPRQPFFSAEKLHLVIAHLGDTRALLCSAPDGAARPLTETHHPEARTETSRLMKSHTGAVTDSFGESRWAGTLANTRGFGDAHYKALGVFAEPAITSRIINGKDNAFLILVSDGVTEKMSDQEIVDLCRGTKDPSRAAKQVIEFAELIGAGDNMTAIVLPLAGWGQITAPDSTKALRDLREKNFEGRSTRQERM